MRSLRISVLAAVTMTVLMLAGAASAVEIGSDLTPDERAAMAKMFESLAELVTLDGEVTEQQQRELVVGFLQSLGSVSRAAAEGDGDAAIGIEIERLFRSIGALVELGDEAADSPEMRRAASDLMRTIGSLAASDPDNDLSSEQAALITGLFDALADLIEHEGDPQAEKRFASQLFLALAGFLVEDGEA